jgi:hypothetical protein
LKRASNRNQIAGEADRVVGAAIVPDRTERDAVRETVEPLQSSVAPRDEADPASASHQRSRSAVGRWTATTARLLNLPAGSDADALSSVLVAVALAVVALFLGYLAGAGAASPLLTVPLLGLVVFCALFWAGQRPAIFSVQAPEAGDRPGCRWRILLIASQIPTVEQLQVLRIAEPRAILNVHAPVLPDQRLPAETEREIELARNRLGATLALAERAGIAANGEVGDPSDPFAGIEEQLGRQHIDEVIVATHPLCDRNAVESQLLEQLRTQTRKPVTHVEIR